jgi:predicted lipoprotein with Yx(FWY)xxD motif
MSSTTGESSKVTVTRALSLAGLAATAALLLAGCGSGETKATAAGRAVSHATSAGAKFTAPRVGDGTVVTTKKVKLGTILGAGPKRLTVYLFEGDKGSTSSCYGECAKVWPPVTTKDYPGVSELAIPAELGIITRKDGVKQVTYFHHPLYFYSKDTSSRDYLGQGVSSFGAKWYALRTIGVRYENSKIWD